MEKSKKNRRSRWVVPGLALAGGGAYFVATWIGGNPALGAGMLTIVAAYAALLFLGDRLESVRALRGQFDDERDRSFDLRATAYAGLVTMLVLIGGFLYVLGWGEGGWPYSMLLGVAGASYITSLIWLRWRS